MTTNEFLRDVKGILDALAHSGVDYCLLRAETLLTGQPYTSGDLDMLVSLETVARAHDVLRAHGLSARFKPPKQWIYVGAQLDVPIHIQAGALYFRRRYVYLPAGEILGDKRRLGKGYVPSIPGDLLIHLLQPILVKRRFVPRCRERVRKLWQSLDSTRDPFLRRLERYAGARFSRAAVECLDAGHPEALLAFHRSLYLRMLLLHPTNRRRLLIHLPRDLFWEGFLGPIRNHAQRIVSWFGGS